MGLADLNYMNVAGQKKARYGRFMLSKYLKTVLAAA